MTINEEHAILTALRKLRADVEALGALASDPRVVLCCERCGQHLSRDRFEGAHHRWAGVPWWGGRWIVARFLQRAARARDLRDRGRSKERAESGG